MVRRRDRCEAGWRRDVQTDGTRSGYLVWAGATPSAARVACAGQGWPSSVPRPIASWCWCGGCTEKSQAVMAAMTRCIRCRFYSITERGSSNRRDVHLILLKSPLRACAATILMYRISLRICNAKATLRMRLCIARRSHLHRAKFIPQLSVNRRKIVSQNPAMMPVLF